MHVSLLFVLGLCDGGDDDWVRCFWICLNMLFVSRLNVLFVSRLNVLFVSRLSMLIVRKRMLCLSVS